MAIVQDPSVDQIVRTISVVTNLVGVEISPTTEVSKHRIVVVGVDVSSVIIDIVSVALVRIYISGAQVPIVPSIRRMVGEVKPSVVTRHTMVDEVDIVVLLMLLIVLPNKMAPVAQGTIIVDHARDGIVEITPLEVVVSLQAIVVIAGEEKTNGVMVSVGSC